MQIVPRSQTRLNLPELARAIAGVFRGKTGAAPPRVLVKMLGAEIGFESAWAPVCNNVGNLMAAGFSNGVEVSRWNGPAWRPPWFELGPMASDSMVRLHTQMLDGQEPSAFRAYLGPTGLEDGIRDWFGLLANHYPNLIRAAALGDWEAFAHAYQADGYCPRCSPSSVAAAMRARGEEMEAAHAFDGIEFGAEPGAGGGGVFLVVAAVTAGVLVWLAQRTPSRKAPA